MKSNEDRIKLNANICDYDKYESLDAFDFIVNFQWFHRHI